MFDADRATIENKYHKVGEPFDPYRRMAYHGYAYDESTGWRDQQIREGLRAMRKEWEELPHPVAKARAVAYVLEHTMIDVNEHDWFVGLWSVDRLASETTQQSWYHTLCTDVIPDVARSMDLLNRSGAVSIWPDFDHVVPDWDAILTLGFPGLLSRAERYREECCRSGAMTAEKEAFYDGIILTYRAILALLDRLYAYASTRSFEKAARIATCLKHIREGAPGDIYEAMQVIYLYFMISECFDSYQVRSLGNGLDRSLYPFYQNDLASGKYSRAQIREFLRYFLAQWSAIGNYWGQPFYLGGRDAQGNTRYNDLSFDILDVYDKMDIYNPKIQLKIYDGMPEQVLTLALDMVRRGHSSIVFCCETGMCRAAMRYGATYEEALDMDIRGCYEIGVRANEVSTATGYVNAVRAVQYVFSNGYDAQVQAQVGCRTGALDEFRDFASFYHAVLQQWGYLIHQTIDAAVRYEPYLSYINPSNMYSATIEGALAQGVDAYQAGVKFNNSAILNCAFASLVDSVMAVKECVYDTQCVTLPEMKEALDNNWQGYEWLRTRIRKSAHKYGNNDAETDRYAAALSAFFTDTVDQVPNARGGVFKAVMHSAMQFVVQGKKTGATPDGRYAGEELSKNASPSVGMDKNGVTALLNSVIQTDPSAYTESHCIDLMLHPSVTAGDEGLQIMRALLFTYCQSGGQSIQFNVFHADTLRDAQAHPEKYKNLQVRVCGWNVLWNNLSREEQNAYIQRAENSL